MVLVGGGYWPHYLIGLLPGLVVLAAASVPTSPRISRALLVAYGYAGLSTLAVLGWVVVHPVDRSGEPAIAYLERMLGPVTPRWSRSGTRTSWRRAIRN